jgi:hypothetical protein
MPSTASRRFAAVSIAIGSMLSLMAFSADASAKSSRTRSHTAGVSRSLQSYGAGGYVSGTGMLRTNAGVVLDNTGGWGCAGAF